MGSFLAVVLVCSLQVGVDACDEGSAVDVLSVRVDNELGCTMGWQEIIARSAVKDGIGQTTYLKTLCRRLKGRG